MNSVQDVWQRVLDRLAEGLTPTAMNTWFSDCEPVELLSTKLVICSPQEFKRNIIVSRFAPTMKEALSDLFSCDFDLQVLAEGEIEVYKLGNEFDNPLPEMEDYTFDRFIVGHSNKFAHAASIGAAQKPGKMYNPLFIYGSSGLGKTHLLLAIGHHIHSVAPSAKISYVKGDDFTNGMIESLKTGTQEEFRLKHRYVDLFLVDDVQSISGKMSVQEEFFHTFNHLYEAGKQIVITSDRPPGEIHKLEARLRSRFEGGIMADVQQPDYETRVAITSNKSARLGLNLPSNVVVYIATHCTANIRQIEGVCKKLTAYHDMESSPMFDEREINEADVRRAMKEITLQGVYVPTPDVIIEETAKYYSLTVDDLKGQKRTKHLAEARQIAMYLMRNLTSISLADIGKEFGDRNHATVLSSIRKIEDMVTVMTDIAGIVRDITSNISTRSESK